MKELLVLRDLECIKAIAHPKRIDILKRFNELPLSAKQISQILDEPHAKINYHIKTLYKVGILELVEEKIKSGIVEKYYYPSAKNIVIGNNILDFSLNTEEEKKELCISKFENISDLFYKAAEEDRLLSEISVDYSDVYLTVNEINQLNDMIETKIAQIIESRDNNDINKGYEIALLAIPMEDKVISI